MKHLFQFPYLRNVYVLSIFVVVVLFSYNVVFVYPGFDAILTQNAEEDSVRVGRFLSHHVAHGESALFVKSLDAEEILEAVEHFKLWKIKIFSSEGEVVFSTDSADVDQINENDYFHDRVAKGEVVSMSKEKHDRTLEGEVVPRSIVETYVPILHDGEFAGAFEIYYDITERKRTQEALLLEFSLVSFLIAAFFLILMLLILRRMGKSLHDRQQAEEKMRLYQKQLVESEKMASLGGLVAGVAHEINTPVGAAVTAASTLEARTRSCAGLLEDNRMKRTDLKNYFEIATGSAQVILSSLRQAANLIRSFKQVAVDQSSERRATFRVKQCIDDVLLSLQPTYKRTAHVIEVDCPEDLEIDSYPGALSRVFTNLIVNSFVHGFDGVEKGRVSCTVSKNGGGVLIEHRDDGRGMGEDTLSHIFEPFFTTKRGRGGSGLGLHIVYNLVTQNLRGTIECASQPEAGAVFTIRIPAGANR